MDASTQFSKQVCSCATQPTNLAGGDALRNQRHDAIVNHLRVDTEVTMVHKGFAQGVWDAANTKLHGRFVGHEPATA
jgi:hypothetical protein